MTVGLEFISVISLVVMGVSVKHSNFGVYLGIEALDLFLFSTYQPGNSYLGEFYNPFLIHEKLVAF